MTYFFSDEYIEYLLNTANAKLQENFRRIAVFEEKLFQYIGMEYLFKTKNQIDTQKSIFQL